MVGVSKSVCGYNLFAYCFNNPVNMEDQSGHWPKWVKTCVSRVKYALTMTKRIFFTAPLKAVTGRAGIGTGLGVKQSIYVGGAKIDVEASASITDSVSYKNGKIDTGTSASAGIGFNVLEVLDFSASIGKEHSFSDDKCECNPLTDPFGERITCPANDEIMLETDTPIGVGGSVYIGIGFEYYVGIDLEKWMDEMIDIFHDSIKY